ncbi:MAG TPA: DUF3298 and DUF4163 domain-containing protein [Syntrophomonadaceae bacterium]|nr:DUF3298 and DUF4163 domain-containing protein [Syntrophomonadaceae bacterium]
MNELRNDKWKKQVACLTVIILLLLGLPACGKKQAPRSPLPQGENQTAPVKKPVPGGMQITTRSVSSQEQYYKVDLKIPVIEGMRQPKTQLVLNDKLAAPQVELRDQLGNQVGQYVAEAKKLRDTVTPYELVSTYEVHIQRSMFLSLTEDVYQFTGGAHGSTQRLPFNFDLDAGKELSLKELFPTGYDYQTPINQEIKKQIATHPQDFFQDKNGFQGISAQQPYYVENGNLVVYFGQYAIAPYSSGIQEFKIPFTHFNGKIDNRVLG